MGLSRVYRKPARASHRKTLRMDDPMEVVFSRMRATVWVSIIPATETITVKEARVDPGVY